MTNPAKKPRKILKASDPSFKEASKTLKEKVSHLYKSYRSDPMDKKVYKELQKHIEKHIEALAPYDPVVYTLIEGQWMKLCDDFDLFLKNPKDPILRRNVSDAFIVLKQEVDNIAA